MLVVMTTSDEAVQALVTSSGVPLAAVDLPSERLLAVNATLAGVLGSKTVVGGILGAGRALGTDLLHHFCHLRSWPWVPPLSYDDAVFHPGSNPANS